MSPQSRRRDVGLRPALVSQVVFLVSCLVPVSTLKGTSGALLVQLYQPIVLEEFRRYDSRVGRDDPGGGTTLTLAPNVEEVPVEPYNGWPWSRPADANSTHRSGFKIYRVSRIGQWRRRPTHETSLRNLMTSALWQEWSFFGMVLLTCIYIHSRIRAWGGTVRYGHLKAFAIWMSMAAFYNLVIWQRMGSDNAKKWLVGYTMELVFSMENVFIFHIILSALERTRRQSQYALFVVICCQIAFQMVFYMGLADWLQSIQVLPYFLGLWLLYLGVETLRKGDDHGGFDVQESSMLQVLKAWLGGRLSSEQDANSVVFTHEEGMWKVTMLGPCIILLLIADFVMEVDVTLAKIEEIPNHYVAFTSSAIAAFAVPTLYFVAREMFARYSYLKYGITFVLLFFGGELLLHEVVHISDMVGIGTIILVLILCVILSLIFDHPAGKRLRSLSRLSEDSILSSQDGQQSPKEEDAMGKSGNENMPPVFNGPNSGHEEARFENMGDVDGKKGGGKEGEGEREGEENEFAQTTANSSPLH